jgi:hypothetical protein
MRKHTNVNFVDKKSISPSPTVSDVGGAFEVFAPQTHARIFCHVHNESSGVDMVHSSMRIRSGLHVAVRLHCAPHVRLDEAIGLCRLTQGCSL